jgi:hypothetical protein
MAENKLPKKPQLSVNNIETKRFPGKKIIVGLGEKLDYNVLSSFLQKSNYEMRGTSDKYHVHHAETGKKAATLDQRRDNAQLTLYSPKHSSDLTQRILENYNVKFQNPEHQTEFVEYFSQPNLMNRIKAAGEKTKEKTAAMVENAKAVPERVDAYMKGKRPPKLAYNH